MALEQAQKYINEGNKHVVDMDLEKFFDKVNHDILMQLISEKIEDTGCFFSSNVSTSYFLFLYRE